jgi:hypothetical protein
MNSRPTLDSGPPTRSAFNRGGGGPELVVTRVHIWTAYNRALESTVHIGFRTPPLRSTFNGRGGSRMDINKCAKICGQETSAQINGSKWISDPPWCPAFNQRGGSKKDISYGGPLVTCGIVPLVQKSHPPHVS